MKISETIEKLKRIQKVYGDLDMAIHNYETLGEGDYMLEYESLVVHDNILYIE